MKNLWNASTNVLAACVAAQVMAPATANAQERLEEIIVTAQKREQSIQDVPIAITALSGASLAEKGLSNISQIN
ncbi:MAG: hypothetical protein V3R73_04165, partial [Sphingomonadales bacterium]